MDNEVTFANPKNVTVDVARWTVTLRVIDADGKYHEFVASADSYFTENDHIWFGTGREHRGS